MNELLEKYKKSIEGKRVSVIGIGVSNIPLIRFLCENGAYVTARDKQSEKELGAALKKLENLNVKYVLGKNYLSDIEDDIVFKTPGMRYDVSELCEARERGCTVTSEMEVFFDLCPCKIIAVTGSDGKTTTTTLISEMLKSAGKKIWLGGNIGNPLIGEIEKISKDDIAVLELSSFQLHTMRKSPSVAVVTNMSPNHLDMHKGMEEYIDAKENIFRYQDENGVLVINADNDITSGFEKEAKGKVLTFSRKNKASAYLDGNDIIFNGRKIMSADDIKIPGTHNIENYLAAICAVDGLCSDKDIVKIAKNFGGVEHRIEFVRSLGGVSYYNDSIASSPARCEAGLNSFDKQVILIAGGYDKKIPFDSLGPVIKQHVKKLVLVGVTSEKIKKSVLDAKMDKDSIFMCTEFEEAINKARELAEKGDVVLFSPACASFDMFKNFMVRGNRFKEIVNAFEEK